MKLDVLRPSTVIDLRALRGKGSRGVSARSDGLHLDAFATMATVAEDPEVRRSYPLIADSLRLAASPQLREYGDARRQRPAENSLPLLS